jgi:hypothetical protein
MYVLDYLSSLKSIDVGGFFLGSNQWFIS